MDYNQLGIRILNFFEFCHKNCFEHGICFYENEYYVNVSKDGKIYSSGQAKTLTEAMDECATGLQKGGM